MHFRTLFAYTTASLTHSALAASLHTTLDRRQSNASTDPIAPQVMIVSMFDPEAEVWYGVPEFDLLAQNVSLPGLSPLFPEIHCTGDGDICQIVVGEGEINAATSIQSLTLSSKFDLRETYWLIAGIAGVNPQIAPTCSVTFARYAVQVGLQYEFSQFEIPTNFTSGYIPQGSTRNDEYPGQLYGTEVFEFNANLQHWAAEQARKATLNDSAEAVAYRANYAADPLTAAGAMAPGVYECDVATSDTYFSGTILSEAFGNFTTLMTNGSGVYCTTAQEDNATAEALIRAAVAGLVDFARAIVMRTASDFDRPWSGEAATTNLFWAEQGAFRPAIENIYLAGREVVAGILGGGADGVMAENYVGDAFGTLGGGAMRDIGYADSEGLAKRGVKPRGARGPHRRAV